MSGGRAALGLGAGLARRQELIASGLVTLVLAATAAVQPAAAVAAVLVLFVLVTFILDRRAAVLPLFLWLLTQNTIVAMLESRGLTDVTVWLRRSDEVMLVSLAMATGVEQLLSYGRLRLYGMAPAVVAILFVAIASAAGAGHAPLFVSSLDLFLLLKGALIFVVLAHVAHAGPQLEGRAVLLWMVAAGAVALAAALLELIAPGDFRSFIGLPTALYVRAGWSSLQGPFVHPGVFGWFMAVCAIACVAIAMDGEQRAWLWLVPFLLGILASGRRKPLAGVVVAILVLVWIASPRGIRWRRVLSVIAGLGALALLFWPFIQDLITSALRAYLFARDPMQQARDVLYVASASLAYRYFPLGAGPGLFGGYAARLYYSPLYAQMGLDHVWGLSRSNPAFLDDTFWPHLLGEFGVLGIAVYCWLLFVAVRAAARSFTGSTRSVQLLARFGIGLLVEGLLESVASAGFESSLQALLTFGTLGLIAGAAMSAKTGLVASGTTAG